MGLANFVNAFHGPASVAAFGWRSWQGRGCVEAAFAKLGSEKTLNVDLGL